MIDAIDIHTLAPANASDFIERFARVEAGKRAHVWEAHREWHDLMDRHDRLVLYAPIGHAKSTTLIRWRCIYELARDPNIRIAVIGATQRHGMKLLRSIKREIETNTDLHAIAPHLRRGSGEWNELNATVERSDNSPDPSIAVYASFDDIAGSRIDLIILDDVVQFENSLSQDQRDKLHSWVTSDVLGRLPPTGGRFISIGTPWTSDDLNHRLEAIPGFHSARYSALDRDGRPLLPEMFTAGRLGRRAAELGSNFAESLLFCRTPASGQGRVRRAWVEKCLVRGSTVGGAAFPVNRWDPRDAPTFTGVDLGRTKDKSAMMTIALLPDGTRRIIDLRVGHWTGPELLREFEDISERYGSVIAVEKNFGPFMLDFADSLDHLDIRPHWTSGSNKNDMRFGVDSLAVELEASKWMIPSDPTGAPHHPAIKAFVRELLAYDGQGHTGDTVMAAWICREAIRNSPAGMDWAWGDEPDGPARLAWDPEHGFLEIPNYFESADSGIGWRH